MTRHIWLTALAATAILLTCAGCAYQSATVMSCRNLHRAGWVQLAQGDILLTLPVSNAIACTDNNEHASLIVTWARKPGTAGPTGQAEIQGPVSFTVNRPAGGQS
jgi:hypothetical protein